MKKKATTKPKAKVLKPKKVTTKAKGPRGRRPGDEWAAVLKRPQSGLRALLGPLVVTPAGEAGLAVLASRASNPRLETVRLAPLNVEHAEQLSAADGPPEAQALVLDVDGGHHTISLVIGPREKVGFRFLRFGSMTWSPSFDTSVWARDEWKFEGVDDSVTDVVGDCACELEIDEYQWVVSQGEGQPRFLVTTRLSKDFTGETGVMQYDALDESLTVGELFVRVAAGELLPVAGKKSLFHPQLVMTPERAFVPDTAETTASWRAEFEQLLARPWAGSNVFEFVRARPEARPRLLEAVAAGNRNALMAGTDLFQNEPEWLDALVAASRQEPLSYIVFSELQSRAKNDAVRPRLEELFSQAPKVEDGMSARVLLELARALGRCDDARVVKLVSDWLAGKPLKDAEFAVRHALEQMTLTPDLRGRFEAFVERHGRATDQNTVALRELWRRRS